MTIDPSDLVWTLTDDDGALLDSWHPRARVHVPRADWIPSIASIVEAAEQGDAPMPQRSCVS